MMLYQTATGGEIERILVLSTLGVGSASSDHRTRPWLSAVYHGTTLHIFQHE